MSQSVRGAPGRCLVCEGSDLTRSLFGGYRYRGAAYYRLRCRACGFVFVDPIPGPNVLKLMYGDHYFANYYGGGHEIGYDKSLEASTAAAATTLARIARYAPTGSLLDIGCAGGHFLAGARERGYTCLGVELNPQMAEHARNAFGVEVLCGALETVPLEGASRRFDVIYMGDCLEHLPDPRRALARVRRLLAPGGVFALNGPITLNRSLFTAILRLKLLVGKGRSEWYVDAPPYHLWEWNAGTMRRFLVGNGFRILEFVTREEGGRPCEVLAQALKRPLRMMETAAERLKDVSAWCTNSFLRGFECGDRVLVLSRDADGDPVLPPFAAGAIHE